MSDIRRNNKNNKNSKKDNEKTKVVLLTLILIALIVMLIVLIVSHKKSSNKSEAEVTTEKQTESSKEPATKESETKEPVTEEPATEEPTTEEPTTEEPTTEYSVNVLGKEVSCNEVSLDLNSIPVENLEELITKLEQLPALNHVEMCDCGLTNEQMELLVARFPQIKFVWKVTLGLWTIRTDTVAFSTLKDGSITYRLTNEDCKVLKYCTDMVALDIGHNKVTDISFLQYMPNLRVLILVDNWDGETSERYISDISMVRCCPKLMYLEFFVGSVTDISVLAELPELVDLNISYNPITDITPLLNYTKLERLFLEHTNVSEADFLKLQQTYPNAQVVLYGEGSVDQGWRTHQRYYAMIDMYHNNYVHDLFKE